MSDKLKRLSVILCDLHLDEYLNEESLPMINEAKGLLNELNEENEWLDVNDKNPEFGEWVLLLVNGSIIEGRRHKDYGWIFLTLVYHGCGCCSGSSGDVVTHWMPLPDPPKTTEQ